MEEVVSLAVELRVLNISFADRMSDKLDVGGNY